MMSSLREQLYISTTADDASVLAQKYGLGLEIADFCTPYNMDILFEKYNRIVREKMRGVSRFTFHASYNELCPAAIDPLIREMTRRRFRQAVRLALNYDINKIVIHSGFIPQVYFPEWFVPESVKFWRSFLAEVPEDITICLENVMELSPDMLPDIVRQVNDDRLRLCLDIGHAFSRVPSRPLKEWTDAFAPFLAHVHIHDNDGEHDSHRPLGQGKIDMRRVLDEISVLVPTATFTIENMHAADSIAWLRDNSYI